jgi:hypothetical protein
MRANDRRQARQIARRRKRQRRNEQKNRQVAQDEGDRFGHHGLLMRMDGGLDSGRAAR